MAYYATIDELINSVKDKQMSYRNLHTYFYIRNKKGEIIKVPYKSLFKEYRNFFKSAIINVSFQPNEVTKYRFSPKKLSYDLYNTVELWSTLLELNDMLSLYEFNLEKPIKVYSPAQFKKLLNEVLILEEVIK